MPDRKTEPRKRPRQARSKVLYDALIEATQRLLASEGLDAVTTNRVAELAGVSIGSLYQYFPSREALIAAVIDRKLEQDLIELTPLVRGLLDVELDAALAGLVEVAVRFYRDETPLYRAMVAALAEVDRDALRSATKRRSQTCDTSVHDGAAPSTNAFRAEIHPHAAGRVNRNVLPLPTSLSTQMRPPCASTIPRAM